MRTAVRRWTGGVTLALVLLVAAGAFVYENPLWVADSQVRFQLWRAGVKSAYVEVDGQRVHYFEAKPPRGGGPGKPLVLIHGLGARGEDWSPLIPGLAAAGFHVYVPDLLGYGRSSRPDVTYAISMQENLVADFMRTMRVGRADVSGWSMGGWVAMKLALDDAPMVNRLVLFDSAGVYFGGYAKLGTIFDARDEAGVGELLSILTPNPRPIPPFVARALVRRIQNNIWVLNRSMAAMTNGRDLLNFRLHLITQPTLIVWGRQDALIPLAAGESIHQGIPGSSMLVVNRCGHLTPSECPAASLRAMATFLLAEPPIQGAESLADGAQ